MNILIIKLKEIFIDYSIDENILDDFINLIQNLHYTEGIDNKYITNKLINYLFNNNLYNNNKDLINKLVNKIINLGIDINLSEIILNVIQINNEIDQTSISILIKKILNYMNDKDIFVVLKYLKDIDYLNLINRVELIFRHIITEKDIKKYKNNEEMKDILNEIFKGITNSEKINEHLDKKDKYFQEYLNKFIFELVSVIVQLSNNYVFKDDFYETLEILLNRIKSDDLIIGVFKALFFELYDTNEISLRYIESKEFGLNKYNIKQIDFDLFNYLINIIKFLLKFHPIKEIIFELIFFLDKIYINYEKNISNKNSNCICTFTHIFNSKTIIIGFFHLLSGYQKYMNLYQQKKYYIKDDFKDYDKIISCFFFNIQSPGYLYDFRNYLKDEKIYKEKISFIEEIIQIISLLKEEKKGDFNKNKIFYLNTLELIEIFYSSNSLNANLSKDKEFENIFVKYFSKYGFFSFSRSKVLIM